MRTTGAMKERQRRFAAKNHNLIYRYLHEKGWEVSEYYDIAAFGYLRAVRRYLTEPGLSIYAFSSIAWQAMTQSIASFLRAEARRKDAERRYIREAVLTSGGQEYLSLAEMAAKRASEMLENPGWSTQCDY